MAVSGAASGLTGLAMATFLVEGRLDRRPRRRAGGRRGGRVHRRGRQRMRAASPGTGSSTPWAPILTSPLVDTPLVVAGAPVVRTLIVVPTYNEADNIDEMLRRVRAAVPDHDVLVVDDSSPDGTAALAEAVGAELGRIDVLHRPTKQGLGEAYRAGFALGIERGYDSFVQIDADLSHDPAVLPHLLATLDDGADMVIGSRYVSGGSIPHWPWFRRSISRWGNRYAGLVLGLRVRDATSGFRAHRLEALRGDRVRVDPVEGLRVPDRDRVPRLAGRWADRGDPHRVHRPGPGHVEDDVVDRRGGARPRDLVGLPRPGPAPGPQAAAHPECARYDVTDPDLDADSPGRRGARPSARRHADRRVGRTRDRARGRRRRHHPRRPRRHVPDRRVAVDPESDLTERREPARAVQQPLDVGARSGSTRCSTASSASRRTSRTDWRCSLRTSAPRP